MKQKNNKSKLDNSNDPGDFIRMQTDVALLDSLGKSKPLMAIVIVGVCAFSGFLYFLYTMATK